METIDGSANEGEDYEPLNEILTFEPNETEKEVSFFFIFPWFLLQYLWSLRIQQELFHLNILDSTKNHRRQSMGARWRILCQIDNSPGRWVRHQTWKN